MSPRTLATLGMDFARFDVIGIAQRVSGGGKTTLDHG